MSRLSWKTRPSTSSAIVPVIHFIQSAPVDAAPMKRRRQKNGGKNIKTGNFFAPIFLPDFFSLGRPDSAEECPAGELGKDNLLIYSSAGHSSADPLGNAFSLRVLCISLRP